MHHFEEGRSQLLLKFQQWTKTLFYLYLWDRYTGKMSHSSRILSRWQIFEQKVLHCHACTYRYYHIIQYVFFIVDAVQGLKANTPFSSRSFIVLFIYLYLYTCLLHISFLCMLLFTQAHKVVPYFLCTLPNLLIYNVTTFPAL